MVSRRSCEWAAGEVAYCEGGMGWEYGYGGRRKVAEKESQEQRRYAGTGETKGEQVQRPTTTRPETAAEAMADRPEQDRLQGLREAVRADLLAYPGARVDDRGVVITRYLSARRLRA